MTTFLADYGLSPVTFFLVALCLFLWAVRAWGSGRRGPAGWLLVLALGAAVPAYNGVPVALTHTALTLLPSRGGIFAMPVWQLGYYGPGDAAGMTEYQQTSSACSFNSGAGDGGAQVEGSNGNCFLGTFPASGLPLAAWGASGSLEVTTGSITSGLRVLTLAAAEDFQTGEGVIVCGAGANNTVAAPTVASATPAGAPGSTTYTYTLIGDDGKGGLTPIAATFGTTTGNVSLSTTNYNALAWTAGAGTVRTHVFRQQAAGTWYYLGSTPDAFFNDTNNAGPTYGAVLAAPAWVPAPNPAPITAAQADALVTSISAGGGTTSLTIAASASNTAAGGSCVIHDDTAAVAAATAYANSASGFYHADSTGEPVYYGPKLAPANGAFYRLSSNISSTAVVFGIADASSAVFSEFGFNNTMFTLNPIEEMNVGGVTFQGGATAFLMENANIDAVMLKFHHSNFVGMTDYPIKTAGTYSSQVICEACKFFGTDGVISSDADAVTLYASLIEPSYQYLSANRGLVVQAHEPGVGSATVNAAGSGFTGAAGTMTWSGAGCTVAPVLNVTASGGSIASVVAVATGGSCLTFPSSSATTWVPGGGLSGGSGASFTLASSGTYYNQNFTLDKPTLVSVDTDGVSYRQGVRLADVQGTLSVFAPRGGGEYGGFPLVYVTSNLSTALTPSLYQGANVYVSGGWNFSANLSVSGAIVLEGLPASVAWIGNLGPIQTPIITDAISPLTVGTAVVAPGGGGAGCTNGSKTFTVVGGTGSAATATGTVSGGVLGGSLTVASAGSYTVFPPIPTTLSGDGCGTAPSVDLAIGSNNGFASAVSTWLTAASLTDATPYIRFNLDIGGARSATGPIPASLWPTSIDPYVTNLPYRWIAFTPTATCTAVTGTITCPATGRYKFVGNTTFVEENVAVSGTFTGGALVSISNPPNRTAANDGLNGWLSGSETTTNVSWTGSIAPNAAVATTYNATGSNTVLTGYDISLGGSYESQ